MAKKGRPTKLTPEIHDIIVKAIGTCYYVSEAAKYAKLDTSANKWIAKGANVKCSVISIRNSN